MTVATCKTCGATLPGPHRPSMFDKDGIGNPEHKMTIDSPGEVEHAIESIRCGMEGCKNWCVEGELYCSYHLGPYLEAHPKHTPQPNGGVEEERAKLTSELRESGAYSRAVGLNAQPKELIDWLVKKLAAERTAAKVEELEAIKEAQDRWQTRKYINERLAELRSNDSYGKIDQKDD